MSKSPDRLALFRNRDFAIYWTGGAISSAGTSLQGVAASVFIYTLTDSALMVGVLNFAYFSPVLLFSLYGGVLADRYDRRRLVVVCQSVSLVIAAVLTVITAMGLTTPLLLIAFSFGIGAAYSLAKPSLSALLPALVPRGDLANATAVNSIQFILGGVVGSSVAAAVLAFRGPEWAFGLNTLTFLGPIVAMFLIRVPEQAMPRKVTAGGLESLLEGLRFVRADQTMVVVVTAVVLTNGAVEALRTLAPTFATEILGQDASAAGIIVAASSVGALLALTTFGWVHGRLPGFQLASVGFLLQAVGAAMFALSPSFPLSLLAALPIGLGFSYNTPVLNSRLQELAPEEFRGRIMSTFAMAHLGMRPFSALLAGALASVVGARGAMLAFALVAPVGLWILYRGQGVALRSGGGAALRGSRPLRGLWG
jgi:MFS family permease